MVQKFWEDTVSRTRGFSPNARWFLLASFLFWSQHQVQSVLFNLYLRDAGFLEGFIGRVTAVWALGLAAGALPAAWLVRTRGRRFTLLLSAAMGMTCLLVRSLTLDPRILYSASFGYGIAFSLLNICTPTFLAENSVPDERTELFGIHFAVSLSAGVVGNLFGGQAPELLQQLLHLSPRVSYQSVLASASLLGLLGLFPLWRVKGAEPPEEPGPVLKEVPSSRSAAVFGWHYFLIGTGAGFVIPFFNLYFTHRFHSTTGEIGLYFSSAQIITAMGGLLGPRLARRIGLVRTIVLLQMASLPFLVSLSMESILPLAVVSFWMRATLMQAASPLTSALLVETIPRNRRDRVLAMCNLVWDLGWSGGSWLGGQLMQHVSYEFPYWVTAGFYAAAALCFYLFLRKAEDSGQAPEGQK